MKNHVTTFGPNKFKHYQNIEILSGEDLYAFRCTALHEGNDNISK
jgi:hypothetical protein